MTSRAPRPHILRRTGRAVAAGAGVALVAVLTACGGSTSGSAAASIAATAAPSESTASTGAGTATSAAPVVASTAAPTATTTASETPTTVPATLGLSPSSTPALGDACKLLDPATIKSAIGLEVQAGKPAGSNQCVWIATSTETSPALVQMMQAMAPLSKALTGGAANLDESTIQQAARQVVSVALFAAEPDDPNNTTTNPEDDPPAGAMVPVSGVGTKAFILHPPQSAGTGVALAFVQLAGGRGMMVQVLLATAPSDDGLTSMMKTAAGRA